MNLKFFRCSHRRLTWPQSPPGKHGRETYVTCLDCAQRLRYDWERMAIVKEAQLERIAASRCVPDEASGH